ncbi:MAG: LysE family transporter [Halobacteriota archaeon]
MDPSSVINGVFLVGLGFLTGLSGALIPGPLFAFVISNSLKRGMLSGPLTIIGHVSVECLIILSLLALGLGLKSYFYQFESWIYLIGGIALFFMAFWIIKEAKAVESRSSSGKGISTGISSAKYRYNSAIFGGVLLTAFNPSFIPWWVAIGYPILLTGYEWLALPGIILVAIGHFLSDFAWYSLVSFSFSRGKNFLVGPRYELAMFVIAVFMAILGVIFIITGCLRSVLIYAL